MPKELIYSRLHPRCTVVYALIAEHSNTKGYCYQSRKTLADELGWKLGYFDLAIRELKKANWLASGERYDSKNAQTSNFWMVRKVSTPSHQDESPPITTVIAPVSHTWEAPSHHGENKKRPSEGRPSEGDSTPSEWVADATRPGGSTQPPGQNVQERITAQTVLAKMIDASPVKPSQTDKKALGAGLKKLLEEHDPEIVQRAALTDECIRYFSVKSIRIAITDVLKPQVQRQYRNSNVIRIVPREMTDEERINDVI